MLGILLLIPLALCVLISELETESKSSLLWGPYRLNLYLGMRPRIPDSLMTGLFWFSADDYTSILKAKHTCDQGDDFSKFSWSKFDPRAGGIEEISDNENHVDLQFEYVKAYNPKDPNDQSWALRVKGTPHEGHEKAKTALVFYAGLELKNPLAEKLDLVNEKKPLGYPHDETITLKGLSEDFLNFRIDINDGPDLNVHPKPIKQLIPDPRYTPEFTKHVELNVPEGNIWQAKPIFVSLIQDSLRQLNERGQKGELTLDMELTPPYVGLALPDLNGYSGNTHFIEKIFEGSFEFDILFRTQNSPKPKARAMGYEEITFKNMEKRINASLAKFDEKFEKVFSFNSPYTGEQYKAFGKDFIANLIGGVGYFHGDHLVDRTTEIDEEGDDDIGKFKKLVGKPEGPFELFTAVPSRPFFPRGFYWDEGFHLIPILEYDFDFALEILKSWFDLIDEDGWIAREQILGPEARLKVPNEFQVQNPNIANPPTLTLVFLNILKKAQEEKDSVLNVDSPQKVLDYDSIGDSRESVSDFHLKHPEFLLDYAKSIYPKLQKHYEWFRRTQKGELEEFERNAYSMEEAYRWVGRTEKLCLPSGLDDYPRADVPDIGELHVDIISWVGSFTASMKQLAELLGYEEDRQKYEEIENAIIKNIDQLHWSEEDKTYCDVTLNYSDEDVFVCHKGYVSLFPFVLKLIPHDSPHLEHVLRLMADPEQLFLDYGIRSLSKQDPFFRQGEDYWRGKVWVNINYLILDSLIHYTEPKDGKLMSPEAVKLAKDLYKKLRKNLVDNVFQQFKKTGYGWENYDEEDGHPTGVRHFLGWTSLVVMIMKMPEEI